MAGSDASLVAQFRIRRRRSDINIPDTRLSTARTHNLRNKRIHGYVRNQFASRFAYAEGFCAVQTVVVSTKDRRDTHQGPKRVIWQIGMSGGSGGHLYGSRGFEERARKLPLVVDDSGKEGILLDTKEAGGGHWRIQKIARMASGRRHLSVSEFVLKPFPDQPDCNFLRASTKSTTRSPFQYSSELCAELIISHKDLDNGAIKTVTLFKKNVDVASCCCTRSQIGLPLFSTAPTSTTTAPKPTRMMSKTYREQPGTYPYRACACNMAFDQLKREELDFLIGSETEDYALEGRLLRRAAQMSDSAVILHLTDDEMSLGKRGEEEHDWVYT